MRFVRNGSSISILECHHTFDLLLSNRSVSMPSSSSCSPHDSHTTPAPETHPLSPATSQNQRAIGYLQLPLELRQKILSIAFEEPHSQDLELHVQRNRLTRALPAALPIFPSPSAHHVKKLAYDLRQVHRTIQADMCYPLKCVLEQIEESFPKSSIHGELCGGFGHSKSRRWTAVVYGTNTSGPNPQSINIHPAFLMENRHGVESHVDLLLGIMGLKRRYLPIYLHNP